MTGILHLAFSDDSLKACLERVTSRDLVVMMGPEARWHASPGAFRDVRVMYLRGAHPNGEDSCGEIIGYAELVELTVQHPLVLTW